MKLQPRQKRMMNNQWKTLRQYWWWKWWWKSRLFLQKKPSRSLVNDYQLSWLYARKYCKENNIAFHSSRVKYLQWSTGLSRFIIDYRRKEIVDQLKPIFNKFFRFWFCLMVVWFASYFLFEYFVGRSSFLSNISNALWIMK